MRRPTLLLVLVAFTFSCGAQWPVLQCVAWANMIREYSEMVPLTQAVKMTFSGQYPCGLCKAISERKQQENAKLVVTGNHEKKVISPLLAVAAPLLNCSPQIFVILASSFSTRGDVPPVPPPRFA